MATLKDFPNKQAPLRVKDENIDAFEIEINEKYNPALLSKEENMATAEHNRKFEEETLQAELLGRAFPCACQQQALIERAQRRMQLMAQQPVNGQIPITVEQEDIDKKKFSVVLNTADGKIESIGCIVSECTECHEVHIWGNAGPIGRMIAVGYNDYLDRMSARNAAVEMSPDPAAPTTNGDSPMFMMENLETGETRAADDLGELLRGGATENGDFKMEHVEPKTEGEM